MTAEPDSKPDWRIGPLRIEKRTSFTSITAFLLSVIAFFSLIWSAAFGNDLELVADDDALFFAQRCYGTEGAITVEPVIGLSFYSSGGGNNSVVVTKVRLDFLDEFPSDKEVAFDAKSVVDLRASDFDAEAGLLDTGSGCAVQAVDGRYLKNGIEIARTDGFHPQIIGAGSAVRLGLLSFEPSRDPADASRFARPTWDDFIKLLETRKGDAIAFRLTPHVENVAPMRTLLDWLSPDSVECTLFPTEEIVALAKEREFFRPVIECDQ